MNSVPSETPLRKSIQVAASRVGARLFRLNTAVGWVGKVMSRTADMVTIANARPLHAGLGIGGSDLIGWTKGGRFLAIEVKSGRVPVTPEQQRFIDGVLACGGRAGVARSVEDALRIIEGDDA